jgi:hypothetical protein
LENTNRLVEGNRPEGRPGGQAVSEIELYQLPDIDLSEQDYNGLVALCQQAREP